MWQGGAQPLPCTPAAGALIAYAACISSFRAQPCHCPQQLQGVGRSIHAPGSSSPVGLFLACSATKAMVSFWGAPALYITGIMIYIRGAKWNPQYSSR